MRLETLHTHRARLRGLLGKIVFAGHLLADGGELPGHVMLEFLQFGAWLRCLARLGGVALFDLGLASRDDLSDGFPLRIDQQVLQILI